MAESYVEFMKQREALSNHREGSQHHVALEPRYVRMPPSDQLRWLKARLRSGAAISLCEYTKVTMIKSEDGYTYFRILDGAAQYVGFTAYVRDKDADAFLSGTPPTASAETVSVKYAGRSRTVSVPRHNENLDQQWATMTVSGRSKPMTVTLNSEWDGKYTPIPPGKHRIMTPDAPHDPSYTKFYVDYARKTGLGDIIADQVWFPIELEGSSGNSTRYVHIGNFSEGCVTVYALERWNDVYNYLISHRLPDTQGRYVAYLEVAK